ncbi:hypothetical protein Glove_350g37 [Diversispora epigaea]|uniref:Uncharacterized protein n=1 Tax=Diversispora epigaea TaxID=1348612 RepID=A0A397HH51_9GLOM|nr:hypothetical protein Glove_350g37 [Diversispora epigaea]
MSNLGWESGEYFNCFGNKNWNQILELDHDELEALVLTDKRYAKKNALVGNIDAMNDTSYCYNSDSIEEAFENEANT